MSELVNIIETVKSWQRDMTDDERMKFWEEIQEDYCKHCGGESLRAIGCQCWNDE